ncbi:MAG: NrsF family protein [Myxococcaceae bacterium]
MNPPADLKAKLLAQVSAPPLPAELKAKLLDEIARPRPGIKRAVVRAVLAGGAVAVVIVGFLLLMRTFLPDVGWNVAMKDSVIGAAIAWAVVVAVGAWIALPSPNKREVNRALMTAGAATAVILVGGFVAMGSIFSSARWDGRPHDYVLIAGLVWVFVALVATWAAFPGNSLIGRPRIIVLGVGVAVPLVLTVAMVSLTFIYPETANRCVGRAGYRCLDITLTLGSLPVLALLFARRAGWSARPRLAGASTGIAIGAWTGVAITLSCECTNPSHVLLGHVLPIVLLALFGTWVAERMGKPVQSSSSKPASR